MIGTRDVACVEETRSVYEMLVGKPEETEGRHRLGGKYTNGF